MVRGGNTCFTPRRKGRKGRKKRNDFRLAALCAPCAYAEYYGLSKLYSADFEDGRLYGSVRALNPFLG